MDVVDLLALLVAWGDCPEPCCPSDWPADLTGARAGYTVRSLNEYEGSPR